MTAIVLCAGGSTRMGTPKGLLHVDGRPLLRAHVDTFLAAGLPVRVVLGAAAEAHRAVLPPEVLVVSNPRWAETGMAESLACAIVPDGACLVTPVDTPPARAATIAALLAHPGDAVPTFEGAPGHPVRIDPPHPTLRLDVRTRGARPVPVDDPDVLLNLNTPEEWARWRARRDGGARLG